jgi:hypothetical protein
MSLQDATAANAAPRSADRGADRGDPGSYKALSAVVIGTNIVRLAAAATGAYSLGSSHQGVAGGEL